MNIVNGKYFVSGQPNKEDFSILKKSGPFRIINLRNKKEFSEFNEALLMEEMNLPLKEALLVEDSIPNVSLVALPFYLSNSFSTLLLSLDTLCIFRF